jgi:hypothetical protein
MCTTYDSNKYCDFVTELLVVPAFVCFYYLSFCKCI